MNVPRSAFTTPKRLQLVPQIPDVPTRDGRVYSQDGHYTLRTDDNRAEAEQEKSLPLGRGSNVPLTHDPPAKSGVVVFLP